MRDYFLFLTLGAATLIQGFGPHAKAQSPTAKSIPQQANKLAISTTAIPTGRVAIGYSSRVAATGGKEPYNFAETGLPAGLSIDKTTGVVSGKPAPGAVGRAAVTVKVTDSTKPAAQSATARLALWIYQAADKEECGQLKLGDNASFNGFVPFQPTDLWDTDISNAPVDPDNEMLTSTVGFAGNNLHPDFSSPTYGAGIPYVVVDSSAQPLVPVNVGVYASESDVALEPIPITAPIEGAPPDCAAGGWPHNYLGDAHVLVVDRNTCFLYETFNTHRCNGQWASDSETIWDLKQFEHRPWGWTSADAAGLAIMPGLVRYDEVQAGAINHAIRYTMQATKNDNNGGYFVEPASHAAGSPSSPPWVMGMRIRLNADFDISGFSKANQVILTAMKQYGMIVADNGQYFFFQGAPSAHWNDNDLDNLKNIASSNFEVVDMTPQWPGWDSATAPTGDVPAIHSFTASATSVKPGATVTLKWNIGDASYLFIDKLGGVRGESVTVKPASTTTYTLSATNESGRSTRSVTVKVE
ncbi:MAG: putative Ig domain-containing protein [Terracidiphilus sp.]